MYGDSRKLAWKERLTSVWRPLYAPFAELLQWVPDNSRILDIGCGSGAFLFLARDAKGATGTGLDTNADAISLACLAAKNADLRFLVQQMPTSLQIEAASLITLIDVLHHVPRPNQGELLLTILQQMQPGSRIIFKDLDPRPVWRSLANRVTDYASTRSLVSYVSRADIERTFQQAGLTIRTSVDLHKHVWSITWSSQTSRTGWASRPEQTLRPSSGQSSWLTT